MRPMISWNQWLGLFSQPIFNVFNHKKLYINKKKRPFLEGLEERITPVNPSVISILRNAGTTASTSASYAVSFSESVTGVDSADFTTSTSGGVASTSISVTGSGATYTVTISGITGTGSISLNLIDNDTIRNSTSQPLGGTNLAGISFSAKTDYSTGASSGPHAITTGLINADGFTDIITANRFNSKISVLLGVGDGTFSTQTSFNTGNTPQSITTGDINGDSKLDLVTANNFSNNDIPGNVSVFLGNGNNSFITKPVVATQNGPVSVILGNFNAGNNIDIATANYGSNSVSIFLGNGNGTFIAATNFATGSGPKSVAMGDVNGDGFLDLATANFSAVSASDRLSLLLGNGDGSFKAPTYLTSGTKPFSLIMADINGDGKKDLISANYNSANVSILLGNGNGTFQSATSASTGTRPVSVAAADLDGDGKIDLAVANSYNNIVSPINSISLLAGNGDGTFKTAVNFTTGTRPYCVTIADINGDSKPDIATANEGSDNISVFLNTTNNPSNFAGQTYTVDATAPTIAITSDKTALKSGETATITFTLSEASSTFIEADISITSGTLSNFTGSGTSYTATFTPTANITTTATFNVLANTFTDTAGNNNTAATQLSINIDTAAPTITITSSASALKSGETATITFTLSEISANFTASDITTVGGTLSTLTQGSGNTYTATFTPTNNSTTPATFNVLANTFTDGAGNPNTAASQLSINIDTVAPTITITSSASALKSGETATLTFTLSEASSNFVLGNITSAGGTLGTLSNSGLTYTATFTPTNNSTTPATFNVLANTFTDGAGNPSIASNTISMTVDTTTPTPSPAPSPAPDPTPSPTPTPPRMMTASSSSFITSESSTVNLIDQDTGKQINSVTPFPGFSGELRIAMGDMNHDGKMETIVAAGPGGGPAIIVMDSETGTVLQTFFAFDPAFKGGIFVAIADFNSDGIMDIVVGAGSGGGPHVNIFDGLTLNVLRSFFAYQENFSGGVSVAAIDINGNGFAELVTGAGIGGNSHVKVFDGKTFEIISQWYAYPSDFKGGIFVAVGDIGNDGTFEVATGAGEGGGPVVAIWDPYTGALLNQFLAYDENFRGGARVGISDGNGDGIADLLTGAGPGGGPQVNGYSFPALDLLFSFYSGNPNNAGGVFVS